MSLDTAAACRGLSLTEIIVVIILITVTLVPMLGFFSEALERSAIIERKLTMVHLGESLMEEILSREFSDPANPYHLGLEEGNWADVQRKDYDDVDDYSGWNRFSSAGESTTGSSVETAYSFPPRQTGAVNAVYDGSSITGNDILEEAGDEESVFSDFARQVVVQTEGDALEQVKEITLPFVPASMVMDPGGRELLIAGTDGKLARIDSVRGEVIQQTAIAGAGQLALDVSTDGEIMAVGDRKHGNLYLFEKSGLRMMGATVEIGITPEIVLFSPDMRYIHVLSSSPGAWEQWMIPAMQRTAGITLETSPTSAVLAPDGGQLFTLDGDAGTVGYYDVGDQAPVSRPFSTLVPGGQSMSYLPEMEILAVLGSPGVPTRVIDSKDGSIIKSIGFAETPSTMVACTRWKACLSMFHATLELVVLDGNVLADPAVTDPEVHLFTAGTLTPSSSFSPGWCRIAPGDGLIIVGERDGQRAQVIRPGCRIKQVTVSVLDRTGICPPVDLTATLTERRSR